MIKKGSLFTAGILMAVVVLFLIPGSAEAQEVYPSKEDSKLPAEIESYIEERKEGTASVSLAVFNGQETVYQTQYGYAIVEEQIKVDRNTVYEWGSVSKMAVWVSVMQLYERKMIDLEEDIRNYLPEGFLSKLKYDEPITMIHLMNHTAGFQNTVYTAETSSADKINSLKETLLKFQPAQINKPGEVCAYSNWGVSLAAYIVEYITGQSYFEYVDKNIFAALGMEHTALLPDWSDNPWVQEQRQKVGGYAIYTDSFEPFGDAVSYILLYPSGAITGTLDDFIKFAKAFVPEEGEGGQLFTKSETLEAFFLATSYYTGTDIPRNYHGLWTLPYGNGIIGHNGNTAGFSSSLYIDPATKTGIVVMTNEVAETAYNYGLLSVVFGSYQGIYGNITQALNVSGIYTSSRTVIEKGFARIYRYIGMLMPLTKTEIPLIHKLAIGQGTLTQISDYVFLMDNENGMQSLKVMTKTTDGIIKFESYTQDEIQENNPMFWLRIALFLLFGAAVLYSFVVLIINLIRMAINLFKQERPMVDKRNAFQTGIGVSLTAVGALVISLLFGEGLISFGQAAVKCILVTVFTVFANICSFVCLKNEIRMNRNVFSGIVTMSMSLIVLANVFYWQWYNFWSF